MAFRLPVWILNTSDLVVVPVACMKNGEERALPGRYQSTGRPLKTLKPNEANV